MSNKCDTCQVERLEKMIEEVKPPCAWMKSFIGFVAIAATVIIFLFGFLLSASSNSDARINSMEKDFAAFKAEIKTELRYNAIELARMNQNFTQELQRIQNILEKKDK